MAKQHIVFLHGFLENSSMWKPILNRISKTPFEIHLPELPGHGTRPLLPSAIDIDGYADDILSQIPIGPDESFIFIGHSMGGYVGCNIARRFPSKIKAFCLFHSKASPDSPEKKQARLRAIEAAKENKDLYIRTMITGLFSPNHRERLHDTIETLVDQAKEMSIASIQQALTVMMNRYDELPTLIDRNFPLFYFLGDQDPSLPLPDMKEELAQTPGAAHLIIEGIGHMGHFEHPHVAGEFIQRILRSLNI